MKQVYVQDSAIDSFLEALVYKTRAAEESKTAYYNVSFPKLRHIGLGLGATDFITIGLTPILIDMLLACLIERCERYRCFV